MLENAPSGRGSVSYRNLCSPIQSRDRRERRQARSLLRGGTGAFACLLQLFGSLLLPAYAAESAQDLAKAVVAEALDPDACYRVNDLRFSREDIRVYFNHGYLIFAKPVNGVRPGAYFDAESDTGDGEVLLLPPNRAERLSMSRYTGTPNLDAHFKSALLIFSDSTAADLMKEMERRLEGEPLRRDPKMGATLAEKMSLSLQDIYASYQVRSVHDLLTPAGPNGGFFLLATAGSPLGSFTVMYEPAPNARVNAGQMVVRDSKAYFNVWTSFPARSARNLADAPRPDLRTEKYRIDATIHPDLSMSVTSRLSFEAVKAVEGAVRLFIAPGMRVTSATLDGEPAEILQQPVKDMGISVLENQAEFLLIPSHPIAPGKHEAEFRHEGSVITETDDHTYYVSARGVWYPQLAMEQADFDITYRYPKDLGLVSTGDTVENRAEGKERITRATTAAPIRFAGFNLGDYERVKITRGPYTIELCANRRTFPQTFSPPSLIHAGPGRIDVIPSPDTKDRLQTLAYNTASTFSFMADMLGPPRIHSMTVSPIPGTFGQGFPGLIYLSTLAYLDPSQRPKQLQGGLYETFFNEILESHEIAHQWWGNLVVPASLQDEWLMESLANYSALLYLEKRKGPQAVAEVLDSYKEDLLKKDAQGRTLESTGPIVWGLRLRTSDAPDGWRVITYEKGSWIIHMLRQRLGDQKFMAMLRAACERYKQAPLSTEQFRTLAREFLPAGSPDASLENFFENWVYGTGIPTLKLTYTVRGGELHGTLTETGVNEDFTAWAPVVIRDGPASRIRWVQTGTGASSFSMPVKQPTARAELPKGWLFEAADTR